VVLQRAHESSPERGVAGIFSQLSQQLATKEPRFDTWERPSAVMVILAEHPRPAVLLIHRPDTLSHHAGQIAFPGGSFDPQCDSTLWDTASRETREEVGIIVPRDRLVGHLDPVHITVSGFTVAPIVVGLADPPVVVADPSEVAAYHWVDLEELTQCRQMGRFFAKGVWYTAPEFPLSWGRVWGATARILGQLMTLDGREEDARGDSPPFDHS